MLDISPITFKLKTRLYDCARSAKWRKFRSRNKLLNEINRACSLLDAQTCEEAIEIITKLENEVNRLRTGIRRFTYGLETVDDLRRIAHTWEEPYEICWNV